MTPNSCYGLPWQQLVLLLNIAPVALVTAGGLSSTLLSFTPWSTPFFKDSQCASAPLDGQT